MQFARYSNEFKENLKDLYNFNRTIDDSVWKRKFAWRPVKVSVAGDNSALVEHYVFMQFYYTRKFYRIFESSSFVKASLRYTINIPNKDALTYCVLSESSGTQEESDTQDQPKEALTEFHDNLNFISSVPDKPAIIIDSFFMSFDLNRTEKLNRIAEEYGILYNLIKGTKFAKRIRSPEEIKDNLYLFKE